MTTVILLRNPHVAFKTLSWLQESTAWTDASLLRLLVVIIGTSSSVVSFAHFSPTCGRMPLPALSLWSGRRPYRPRLVYGRRGGGPSSVAPRSRNPPTGHRRDSITVFARPTAVRSRFRARQQSQSSPDRAGRDSATSSPILTEAGRLSG